MKHDLWCKKCGVWNHQGLRGSAAWQKMVKAGCQCPHCTHKPCGRADCAFARSSSSAPKVTEAEHYEAGVWRNWPETTVDVHIDQSSDPPSISFSVPDSSSSSSDSWSSPSDSGSDSGFGGGGASGDF